MLLSRLLIVICLISFIACNSSRTEKELMSLKSGRLDIELLCSNLAINVNEVLNVDILGDTTYNLKITLPTSFSKTLFINDIYYGDYLVEYLNIFKETIIDTIKIDSDSVFYRLDFFKVLEPSSKKSILDLLSTTDTLHIFYFNVSSQSGSSNFRDIALCRSYNSHLKLIIGDKVIFIEENYFQNFENKLRAISKSSIYCSSYEEFLFKLNDDSLIYQNMSCCWNAIEELLPGYDAIYVPSISR